MFKTSAFFLVFFVLLSSQLAAEEAGLVDAFKNGETTLDFRLRYEDVDEHLGVNENIEKGAQAATLRSRLTYRTEEYQFFTALVEFDHLGAFPDDDNYNSGSNGQTDDARVLDSEGSEVNRVWLAYDIANTLIKYGRQSVILDNARFVGNDAWRQNEQTFTGVSFRNEAFNYTRLRFIQLNQVEGILGTDHPDGKQDIDAQLFNIEYRGFMNPMFAFGAQNSLLSFYSYYLDNDSGKDAWDTKTYGIRFAADVKTMPRVTYAFEYAVQEDRKDNSVSYSADYSLAEFGVVFNNVLVNAGIETLGADGNGYFVTPLASLHDFQGASGQFQNQGLGNIAGGIEDSYFSLGYVFSEDCQVKATYHDFESDDDKVGPGALGKEWEVSVFKNWADYRLSAKYANYSKDNFGIDTEKLWLSVEARF